MIAGKYNIVCEQGTTFRRTIRMKQPDVTGTEYSVMDLSGFTARMHVRRTVNSATEIIVLTTENGGIEIEPLADPGVIQIDMSAVQTAGLTSDGVYDLEIISPSGVVSRVIQGMFTLSLEVTR